MSVVPRSQLLRPFFSLALVAVASSVLATGGLRHPGTGASPLAGDLASGGLGRLAAGPSRAATWAPGSEPAFLLERRLSGLVSGVIREASASQSDPSRGFELPTPTRRHALGDRLIHSMDDGWTPAPGLDYETRIDVSGGTAGPSDFLAVRVPVRDLAAGLPLRVNDVILGLDDLNGAVTFPSIELWIEDASQPLTPRVGTSTMLADFDAVAAGVPVAPTGASLPSAFQRVAVGVPALDVPDTAWLSDGAFDDDFERADGPLEGVGSDWVECQDDLCFGLPAQLTLVGGQITRPVGGSSTLGVKFAAVDVADVRIPGEFDLRVGVDLDLSNPTAGAAGLALRTIATDSYYRVEYDAGDIVTTAVTPGGAMELGRTAVPANPTARLEVTVSGVSPQVTFDITYDGNPVGFGPVVDTTFLFASSQAGVVASNPASSGEVFDNFVVERRPDVFAVVQLPEGGDAGLPLDVSDDSLQSDALLVSSDGVSFAAPTAGAGCSNRGNPAVQLEIEELTDRSLLFENEARLQTLRLDCATCPTGPASCTVNLAADESRLPTFTVGETVTVGVDWWNQHLGTSRLLLRTSAWSGTCSAPTAMVSSATRVVGDFDGQDVVGAQLLSEEGLLDFVPGMSGDMCVVVEEFHDTNDDCCADGREADGAFDDPGGVCGGGPACTPVAPSDSNPSTVLLLRQLAIEDPCVPSTVSELDGSSLRLAKVPADPTLTELRWTDLGMPIGASYNLHVMARRPLSDGACFEEEAPVLQQLVGTEAEVVRMVQLDAPTDGNVLWLAVFETDGCPSGSSVPDDSAMDPNLACGP
ncbi:MAG: hypothetical protein AAF533_19405 [Acidobacteriota bacterium]